jgi:glutaredoxin
MEYFSLGLKVSHSQLQMVAIKVYSLTNCMYCDKAKDFLRSKNMIFEEVLYNKATDTDDIMFLVESTNWTSFPQIFVDDVFIGGYEQLIEYDFDDVKF